jgi:hypothetical protein
MMLFRGRSMDQIREITFEIGMLGRHAGYQKPQRDARPALASGRAFSALEQVCIMYAGFKRIEPQLRKARGRSSIKTISWGR